ncbi:MAG: AMP-binding protein [Desulfomonile tiedjei]|uniref:acetate--CoA ligase n=1 Tax=Desulfomonile tiedjei TaxID=2358 RepID=A0A9D6V2W1_9BACT|nr:AMP-binding protein [Desulfomonile tiedjei]
MIKARVRPENPNANLKSYYETYKSFSWSDTQNEFTIREDGYINIAYDAVDRWADDPATADRPALIFEKSGTVTSLTYKALKENSSRLANLLTKYGFKVGDRLFVYVPPCPEMYFAMIACARTGVVFSNLYTTLNFEDLLWRVRNAEPRGILTHPDLIENLPQESMESVKCVLLTEGPAPGLFSSEAVLESALQYMPIESPVRWLPAETPLFLLYTSGSTGPPKGVVHAHQDMIGYLMTGRWALDLTDQSILWVDGDPAWVTGTVYGAFAPWLCNAASVVQGDPFSASSWYRSLEKHRIAVWYTTPMTIRRLMEAGADLPGRYDFSNLRHIATVGEALAPELFYWVRENLKHSPHDTWWMTETGMICIANYPSQVIKPGSMGKPVPGVEAAVLDPKGEPLPILTLGELALKPGWPSMMRAIWKDDDRFEAYFRNGWFVTGDMVIKDEDGYYYHEGRNDDLIKVGQSFIGPYEIEQVLCMHPAVAEAGVISKGAEKGKVICKAFVKVAKGYTPSARLNHEIKAFVKTNLHSEIPLGEIEFTAELPKTLSGKLLRRVLRARELGLPSGDPTKLQD